MSKAIKKSLFSGFFFLFFSFLLFFGMEALVWGGIYTREKGGERRKESEGSIRWKERKKMGLWAGMWVVVGLLNYYYCLPSILIHLF